MRRVRRTAIVALALAASFAAPAAAGSTDSVVVTNDRSRVSTELGRSFSFRSTIANRSSVATEPLVAHLNILSVRPGVYVDPEDWSGDRTRYIGSLPANGTRELVWEIQAVNDGSLAAYITVLPQDDVGRPPVSGPAVRISVAKRTTLNSGGILPLAIGIPLALGLLAGGVHLRRRRA
jgi:hypothetical protein